MHHSGKNTAQWDKNKCEVGKKIQVTSKVYFKKKSVGKSVCAFVAALNVFS